MMTVQAQERLDDGAYCARLPMHEFQRLLVRAGYPQDIAHQTAMQRGMDRLSAGESL